MKVYNDKKAWDGIEKTDFIITSEAFYNIWAYNGDQDLVFPWGVLSRPQRFLEQQRSFRLAWKCHNDCLQIINQRCTTSVQWWVVGQCFNAEVGQVSTWRSRILPSPEHLHYNLDCPSGETGSSLLGEICVRHLWGLNPCTRASTPRSWTRPTGLTS